MKSLHLGGLTQKKLTHREDLTVTETHLLPSLPPLCNKRSIIAQKACQMALKWNSFADEIFRFN
jgi:hypothetical protein